MCCPRCSCRHTQKWGSFSGRQRYKCKGCDRTFSDLTGTPAAYIKKLELWPGFMRGMEDGESLRAAAARLRIHSSTAFRWRHRILGSLEANDDEALTGWIELAVYSGYPLSKKGQRRGLGRPPRTHLLPRPWTWGLPPEVAWVAAAADREGNVVTGTVRQPLLIQEEELERILGDRIGVGLGGDGPVLVVHAARREPYQRFVDRWRGTVYRRDGRGRRHTLIGQENAFGYWLRLRGWMTRFRGVATRYLSRYLTWHRWLDRARRLGSAEALLRWPLHADPV